MDTQPSKKIKDTPVTQLIPLEDDPMKPRRLSSEEIENILSVVPPLKSASAEVAIDNRNSMMKTLREQLKEMIVTPLGIDDIKSEILRNFNESIIKPGTAVGVTAAEAIGQPVTQMALNSFHKSGSSKNVTYGIDRISELINASKELKTTSVSIFFKNQNLSFDDVITKVRPSITEIMVGNIVRDTDIESIDDIIEPWWYQPYRTLFRSDFKSNTVLILDMDVDTMYAYKIDMEDVCRVIEKDRSVICVFSPLNIGKIHVYPVEKAVTAKLRSEGTIDKKTAPMVFLWKVVVPSLDKLKISGVSGIKQIYPVEAPVWQIVKDEQKAASVERGWFLIINELRQRIVGISVNKLVTLCKTVGMSVLKIRPNYILVQTPSGDSPTEFVNALIKEDKAAEKVYEDNKRKEGARVLRRPPTAIMNASKIVYADSDGSVFKSGKSTLRTLLANPSVDSTRTYSNNVHEIHAVLGLEAARAFLIKEFLDVIGYEGSYVNPRHIVLLVDFMVSLGEVNGITFSGISGQQMGALEKASFEKAMDTFKEATGFGETKGVEGTSASIYVGKKALVGTGFSEHFIDASKYKPIEEEMNTNPDMKLDIGATLDAINNMESFDFGTDMMIMEGAEEEMFAGGDPILPGGTVMVPGDKLLDPRVNQMIKGPLIRSFALNIAAQNLNNAPLLAEPKQTQIRNKDITNPAIITETIPSSGITEAPLPKDTEPTLVPITFEPGNMGLPADILSEMEKHKSEPPKISEAPIVGLPIFETEIKEVPTKITIEGFDLEDFLK